MVNIDKVYQKVLAFANKEQRGYIHPQEFNLFADQAQMEIFEQYFYDKNQFARIPGNRYEYSDAVNNLEEKIAIFEKYNQAVDVREHNTWYPHTFGDVVLGKQITDIYRLGSVSIKYGKSNWVKDNATGHMQNLNRQVVAEKVQINELLERARGSLTKPNKKAPVYTEVPSSGDHRIKIYPYPHHDRSIDAVNISYIRKPVKPHWGYVVVNHKPLYNSSDSVHFELHPSDESELVYRILAYAGIALEKPGLSQAAIGFETTKQQQEKA